MAEGKQTTQTMKLSDVKHQLSSLVNAVYRKETRILVEKSGIPVAALVSVNDLVRLKQIEQSWEEGTRALERFGAAFADVTPEEAEAEIDGIIAAGRAHDRAESERESA